MPPTTISPLSGVLEHHGEQHYTQKILCDYSCTETYCVALQMHAFDFTSRRMKNDQLPQFFCSLRPTAADATPGTKARIVKYASETNFATSYVTNAQA